MPSRNARIVFWRKFCRVSMLCCWVAFLALGVRVTPVGAAVACQVKATSMSFGGYDILAPVPKDATSQLTITCNNVRDPDWVSVQVVVTAGNSGNPAQRFMVGSVSGAQLYYNLYTNPGMSSVLGDGTSGSTTAVNLVNKTTPWSMTIFGRIPPVQNVPVGIYTDTLIASIFY